MTTGMILRSLFEVVLVAFVIWGLFHEDLFAAFEHRFICAFRRRKLKVVRTSAKVRESF